jgi:acyl-CoA synthetase (AMP-forming)/AMP-acid ligase II
MCGAKLVLPGMGMDGANIYQLLKEENVTFTCGVPTIFIYLLQVTLIARRVTTAVPRAVRWARRVCSVTNKSSTRWGGAQYMEKNPQLKGSITSLSRAVCGGSAVPKEVIAQMKAVLNCTVWQVRNARARGDRPCSRPADADTSAGVQGWGMTESSPLGAINGEVRCTLRASTASPHDVSLRAAAPQGPRGA